MYKVFYNLLDINVVSFFELNNHDRTRGHNFKLIKPVCINNARAFSFACRRINCWNSLPADILLIKSLPVFKEKLNHVNFTNYLLI